MLLYMQAGQWLLRQRAIYMPPRGQEAQHALFVGHRRPHLALLRVGMRLLATRARIRQSDR